MSGCNQPTPDFVGSENVISQYNHPHYVFTPMELEREGGDISGHYIFILMELEKGVRGIYDDIKYS